MTLSLLLTIAGTVASIVGAIVALVGAKKATSAKKAAETARDKVKAAMESHHLTGAIAEARQCAQAAYQKLRPYYNSQDPKGVDQDEALELVSELIVKLNAVSVQFPFKSRMATSIVRNIDEHIGNLQNANDPDVPLVHMRRIYLEVMKVLKLLEGVAFQSRKNT